ncbi:thiol peroxidase [bacterium]|nr:thiol peroxidase [candidate division CSSED10-310 bacterium]
MNQRHVTMHGHPLTLVGHPAKIGETAPDFTVINAKMQPVTIGDYSGKTIVISSVPSLDTPVCDTETRKFNEMATRLGDNVVVLTISMDLPFAQARWCGAAGIDRVVTLSDHATASFGLAYGVLIDNLRLLARSIFVIDPAGIIQSIQLVPEITSEPDYDAVLAAIHRSGG